MNRLLAAVGLVIASTSARADVSSPSPMARPATRDAATFPLGKRCARALERAQTRVGRDFTGAPELTLDAGGARAQFHVSDMCGVAGDGTLELTRGRAGDDTRWRRLARSDEPGNSHVRLTRSHAGWRAVIDVVVEGLAPGDFEHAFRAAVDACFGAR
jgi:hypothetical protein